MFTVGADGAVRVKDALLALPGEILRYELRLALSGGGTVSERPLVLELRPPSPGLADEEVEVPALSESGYALLTVRPTNGGTVGGFAGCERIWERRGIAGCDLAGRRSALELFHGGRIGRCR